jgi:6-phosphogluconolactonase
VVFTVAGAEKRDAFARVRAGDDVPAAHVRASAGGRVVWLVDRAAAGG